MKEFRGYEEHYAAMGQRDALFDQFRIPFSNPTEKQKIANAAYEKAFREKRKKMEKPIKP